MMIFYIQAGLQPHRSPCEATALRAKTNVADERTRIDSADRIRRANVKKIFFTTQPNPAIIRCAKPHSSTHELSHRSASLQIGIVRYTFVRKASGDRKGTICVAKNDTLLLDGIIDDRVEQCLPSERRDEAFEYFAFQQVLRDADLSHDEVLSGAVDGRDDGGIDGIFILVNGNLLADPSSFFWPKHGCQLTVYVITCKHHDTFKQAPVDNLVATVSEIFDLGLNETELAGAYSKRLLRVREILMVAYRRLSPRLQKFEVRFVYASRGDSAAVGSSVLARANQCGRKGTRAVWECLEFICVSRRCRTRRHTSQVLHPHARTTIFGGSFSRTSVCGTMQIVRLRKFHFRRKRRITAYMFDSNIRAFMGLNRVNEDIRDTLTSTSNLDFWWLNNGITILANSACVVAKTIQIDEPQIVYGLQTSESIFRHFGRRRQRRKQQMCACQDNCFG
jgi:hypothetical protein